MSSDHKRDSASEVNTQPSFEGITDPEVTESSGLTPKRNQIQMGNQCVDEHMSLLPVALSSQKRRRELDTDTQVESGRPFGQVKRAREDTEFNFNLTGQIKRVPARTGWTLAQAPKVTGKRIAVTQSLPVRVQSAR
ncbi:hypothetical protein CVT26_015808 [Gymnopilus dilepis]|uniref:Uncharacterized protein n=1 Tax=Gymnopilus dilepis TaxID=231916 RepID=A0A409WMR8_9AGAR|nr:hypothetical protein CVT26_015808 [Gymnopilus dilepis]